MDREVRFRFNRVDLGGPWCLTYITPEDHADLINFLREQEGRKVKEVFDGHTGKDEDVAGGSPNGNARKRASATYPTDYERIASLRLSGARRIWGLRYDHEFSVIWWDPHHEVWPGKRVTTN